MHSIALTVKQAEIVQWAIDGMSDCEAYSEDFDDNCREEFGRDTPFPLPSLKGNTLELPDDIEVIADMLYRLEEQFPAMDGSPAQKRASQRAADEIREITRFDGNTY